MAQKLKIFLSWAGDTSKEIAIVLNDWLPQILQNVEPWFSPDDIEKGGQWATALAEVLESAHVGIICLTPENLSNTWMHFEAGALWKAVKTARVCPFLFNIQLATDVKPPFGMFQSTRAMDKEEVHRLIKTLNSLLSDLNGDLSESRLNTAFEMWWPILEGRLRKIAEAAVPVEKPKRDVTEMVAEVLDHVRGLSRRIEATMPVDGSVGRPQRAEPAVDFADAPKDMGSSSPSDPEDAALTDAKAEG